jgi:RimJ/RimL family protein N-acetyltransferase
MNDSLTIRQYEDSDVDELVTAVHESLNDLQPWMPWGTASYSASDAASWIRASRDGHINGSMYDFAVVDEVGRYLGSCGLNQISLLNGVANLGYWVRSSAAGFGVAPAAVRKVVDWAFHNTKLNRLEVVVAVGNVRSRRVAEKAAAQLDAVLRKRVLVEGRPSDAALYSFVRCD